MLCAGESGPSGGLSAPGIDGSTGNTRLVSPSGPVDEIEGISQPGAGGMPGLSEATGMFIALELQ